GARWTTVEVPLGGRAAGRPRRCRSRSRLTRRERLEDRIETLGNLRFAADHQTVPTLEPPHAAARADVEVVNPACLQLPRAPHVVFEMRIPAVNDDVVTPDQ